MMTPLQTSISTYLNGERGEMIAIIGFCSVWLIIVAFLYRRKRNGFRKGLLLSTLVSVGLVAGICTYLLVRDTILLEHLVESAATAPRDIAGSESERIADVIANYAKYRYLFGAIGLLGVLAMVLAKRDWMRGVGAGMILLTAFQIVVDHYSEARARRYSAQLVVAAASAPPVGEVPRRQPTTQR